MSEPAGIGTAPGTDGAKDSAFAALLARLSAEGGDAQAYESLRRRLIQFFRMHVPADAEELADVVLDRLARRIHEGIDVASVPSYALGIARMVLHEARARSARRHLAEADPTLAPDEESPDDASELESTLAALRMCLDAAGTTARQLILTYYGGDGAVRIATRRRLADECGISLNALRNRALRLRDALEECVRKRTNPHDRA
jgi:DNA-directed RNA polymerase specialized sigma24 family protein